MWWCMDKGGAMTGGENFLLNEKIFFDIQEREDRVWGWRDGETPCKREHKIVERGACSCERERIEKDREDGRAYVREREREKGGAERKRNDGEKKILSARLTTERKERREWQGGILVGMRNFFLVDRERSGDKGRDGKKERSGGEGERGEREERGEEMR